MHRLTVDSLFDNNDRSFPDNHGGGLDVNSLFSSKVSTKKNSDELLKEIYRKKKIKCEIFDRIYSNCWEEIHKLNKNDKTDTILNITRTVSQLPDYDSLECLEYMSKRFNDQQIDNVILSDCSIFVTWYNLEGKKKHVKIS